MLSNNGCHTIKSILRENPHIVMWLFSISYLQVHRRRQRQTTAAEDEDSGRRQTAIKPYNFHIL